MSLEAAQDLQDLRRVLAELDVDALHADCAARVDDDEAHLANAAHHAHRLIWLGQHVVLPRPCELPIEQNWQSYMRDLLESYRRIRRIAIDDIGVRLLLQRVGRLLQLT